MFVLFLKVIFFCISSVNEGLLGTCSKKYFTGNTVFANKICYTSKKVFSSEESIFLWKGLKILQRKWSLWQHVGIDQNPLEVFWSCLN